MTCVYCIWVHITSIYIICQLYGHEPNCNSSENTPGGYQTIYLYHNHIFNQNYPKWTANNIFRRMKYLLGLTVDKLNQSCSINDSTDSKF